MSNLNRNFLKEFKAKVDSINQNPESFKEVSKALPFGGWKIYSFTLPPSITKTVALGFNSKNEAEEFIRLRLHKDWNGNPVKRIRHDTVLGIDYMVFYEATEDKTDISSTFSNPPILTTVGNYYAEILKKWNEE